MTQQVGRGAHLLLAVAAGAVAFAAADTYVVVLALPDMMAGTGIGVDELQRAAPIISGFLLGYVAVLPLIGRIADLRGRVPVLVASLVVFALGSLVTALAYDLPSVVTGRFLQGVGGGGLVPATLALVADLYPVHRRGVPLGVVSAVQEIGSVLGPLLGAVVLAVGTWRGIFALNLAVGVVLALAIRLLPAARAVPDGDGPGGDGTDAGGPPDDGTGARAERRGLPDLLGAALAVVALAAGAVVMVRPTSLLRDLTWGQLFIPVELPGPLATLSEAADGRWVTPLGLTAAAALLLLVLRCCTARRPLVDVRSWVAAAREADLLGAVLLAVALGGVILTFATADPAVDAVSPQWPWWVGGTVVATALLVLHVRRAPAGATTIVPRGALRARPAWGGLVVSFLVGTALIAALVDVPLFARTTAYPDSQLSAALVLLRFLVALPVGAVLGGWLSRRLDAGVLTAAGMVAAAVAFAWMSRWEMDALDSPLATVPLVLGGLGFGLALAPVNAAVLATTRAEVHGLASALVVVARMVGMLLGISALTTLGLRRFQAVVEAGETDFRVAAVAQEQVVFAGAGVCAVLAALLALVLLRGAPTRAVEPAAALRTGG